MNKSNISLSKSNALEKANDENQIPGLFDALKNIHDDGISHVDNTDIALALGKGNKHNSEAFAKALEELKNNGFVTSGSMKDSISLTEKAIKASESSEGSPCLIAFAALFLSVIVFFFFY